MQDERRGAVNRGLDDGLSKAFELALTPVLVAGLGWFIDTRIEATPLFTLVFFFLGVAGTSLSLWYRYDAAMAVEQRLATEARAERTPRRGTLRSDAGPEPAGRVEAAG